MGDYMMVGSEIIQVDAMPRGPDDDFAFDGFGGQRLAYARYYARGACHRSGRFIKFRSIRRARNSRPTDCRWCICLYRNDDGGPGYGKDSLLHFTAPADGDYIVRLRDVRRLSGEDYAYRLTVRQPAPDFMLSVSPRNPNVPLGGRIPITVTALRLDEFDGPDRSFARRTFQPVCTRPRASSRPGQISTTLLLSADDDAKLDRAAPLEVVGRAQFGSRIGRTHGPIRKTGSSSLR